MFIKHICRKWMTDARVERYQVVVQKKAEKRAKEYLNSLEKTLIERFGETMHNHVWIKTPNKKIQQNTSIHNNRQISINEDEDEILQTKIPQIKTASQYGRIMLTGMNLLKESEEQTVDEIPKVMVIHTGDSDESMSGVSLVSKSTQGSVTWDKSVQDKELAVVQNNLKSISG